MYYYKNFAVYNFHTNIYNKLFMISGRRKKKKKTNNHNDILQTFFSSLYLYTYLLKVYTVVWIVHIDVIYCEKNIENTCFYIVTLMEIS